MAPTPQGDVPTQFQETHAHEVVISGIAGLYPKSRYVRDLENILYNKINPISSDDIRWTYNHPEAAQFAGNVPDLNRFDAQFFKVHYRLGTAMDSMSRKVLEQTYEAIYDAGLSPELLHGKKVGVYIGSCFSETEKAYVAGTRYGFGIAGCSKAMFANRISYWLNAKGPSHSIDDACCSSTVALEQAFLAIARGECDAAVVGGANICLHPQSSVHYSRIMDQSKDGKTRSYDQRASGGVKSEAINVLFLQKAKDALRVYAKVINVQSEFIGIVDGEYGPRFGFYRKPEKTAAFLKCFYEKSGVTPSVVEYVEGVGSAVPEVDKSELETFDNIFCGNRTEPLKVGSVMSNIGNGEAASGISAVTKVLLGYHRGELAGNLNCETVRNDVAAIQEGRIQVLNDHSPFQRTFAAVNSMSVTGVNAHVLLHGNYKPKDLNRYKSNYPYLITMSGRQDSSVKRAFGELKSQPIDPEQLALLRNIHQHEISGHLGRGYAVLDTKDGKTVCLSEEVDYYDDAVSPLWFVYSGMGSQWSGMGTELMRLPIFAAAIDRCHQVLESKGIDIVHIITSPDKTIFDNILHSFVGIAAVQIGLTDVLKQLGIVPDNIIGHSVGELGCAYADGCLSAEEMILSAYSRGLVSLETPFIKGSMAAVGLGFQEVSKLCPPEIEIACHNSAESCTISGPADVMKTFVGELTDKKIFAKEVPCSNIAYHSRYIAKAGPSLLKYLKDVINTPKARSGKWLSTSVPEDRWEEEATKYCSAEYHTNNLLSPVLFEETSRLIPSNAVLVEIAPHGLLQAILKRSLPKSCTNIPLTRRGHQDNLRMVLEAVGKLYTKGYNPKVEVLYPKVEFPVSTGTPFLSNLVDWAHSEQWSVPLYVTARRVVAATCKFIVSLQDDEHSYLKGHVIRNKTRLPFAYALVAAWDTLAMTLKKPKKQLNVVFNDVHFYSQPLLHVLKVTKFAVTLQRGTGKFEVRDGYLKIVTGYINEPDASIQSKNGQHMNNNLLDHNSQDIYRLFYEREFSYSGQFRSIHSSNETLTEANLLWNDNWVTFIDGMFQLNTIKHPHSTVSAPGQIRRIAIDVTEHLKLIKGINDVDMVKAHISDIEDCTRCGGVLIEGLKLHDSPPFEEKQVELKTMKFVPRFQSNIDTLTSLQIFVQIVSENINKDIIKVVGIEENGLNIIMQEVAKENIPGIIIEYRNILKNTTPSSEDILKDADILLVKNLGNNNEMVPILQRSSRSNIFIINKKSFNAAENQLKNAGIFKVVSMLSNNDTETRLELVRYQSTVPAISTTSVIVRSEQDLPTLTAARSKLSSDSSLLILTNYPPFSGLKSLVKHWRKGSSRNNINLIMVNDVKDTELLGKLPGDLAYNMLDKGVWGGIYFMPVHEKIEKCPGFLLQQKIKGNLKSLKWFAAPAFNKGRATIKVHYASITTYDVQRATGVIPLKNEGKGFGIEFSGVTESGERVMGLAPEGTVQSHVIPEPELMWPVPSHWSLEDAATVPFAYLYAYYCLVVKVATKHGYENGKYIPFSYLDIKQEKNSKFVAGYQRSATNVDLRKSFMCRNCIIGKSVTSVLIHGGAGALGQALIAVCLANDYEVFTTVSNLEKKQFLLRLFPTLKDKNIGNSRDSSFGDMVLTATNGIGCDLVVCCLKADLKNTSLNITSSRGLALDTVQIHRNEKFNYGTYNLTRNRSYSPVDISSIFQNPEPQELKRLQLLVSEGIALGTVRPLSRVSFAPEEVTRAFRWLAASQHRGRVLLRMHGPHPLVQTRFNCPIDGCHIIFCDEQPLGVQLADMLISAGARKIILHFAQPPNYLRLKHRLWNKQNIQVSVSSERLCDETSITNFVQKANISSGSVYGIYLAADYCIKSSMLTTLDDAVRKLCPSLRNLLMFSNGDDGAQFIAIKRNKEELPATVVDVSMLETTEHEDGLTWYQGIKEASNQALQSRHPVLLSQFKRPPRESLVQQIAGLFDMSISEEDNTSTLKDLGFKEDMTRTIASFLRDVHSISIDEANILSLSIESITSVEETLADIQLEDSKGLGSFFTYVDPDELLATTEIVFLPTLTNNSTMRDDEIDVNQLFLCIVPGLEGHYQRFRAMCERLKLPALVLQPGLDHRHESVERLALRYSQVLLKRAGVKETFLLLGCETGILVALELAAILEKNGLIGTVFCVGDGPEEMKSLIKEQLLEYQNEEELQIGLVKHMFTLMTGMSASLLENIEGVTWKQRVDTYVRTLLGHVSHSVQYASSLLESAYTRIISTISYNPRNFKPLRSDIVVLRALSPYSAASVPCTLQRFSEQPIVVHNLASPLAHVTRDSRCASLINRHLPKHVLEEFATKNLNKSYLLNADVFMTVNLQA